MSSFTPLLLLCLTKHSKREALSLSPYSPSQTTKMGSPALIFLKHNIIYLKVFIIFFLSCVPNRTNLCPNHSLATLKVQRPPRLNSTNIVSSLETLGLDGYFSFENNHHAAKDFGNMYHFLPSAVLRPKSVQDISNTIKHIYEMGSASELTVAARGMRHILHHLQQLFTLKRN